MIAVLDALAAAVAQARVARLLVGTAVPRLCIYGAPAPASGGAVGSAPTLAIVDFDPDGISASNRQILIAPPATQPLVLLDGDAVWARLYAADGAAMLDFDCGALGSTAGVRIEGGIVLRAGSRLLIAPIVFAES